MKLPPDFREFIELLNSENVKYLIVGGWAVAFHGHPRFTGDLDFFVEASSDNAGRLMRVLGRFGFTGLGLQERDFLEPDRIIQLGRPPRRIDLITGVSGVGFAEAWAGRESARLDGIPVQVIGREALLKNKAAAGRPQDAADLTYMSTDPPGETLGRGRPDRNQP